MFDSFRNDLHSSELPIDTVVENNKLEYASGIDLVTSNADASSGKLDAKMSPVDLTDHRIPQEFQRFLRKHTNGIKYMQCDKCSFICRPLMTLFSKHYKIHAGNRDDITLNQILQFEKAAKKNPVMKSLDESYRCNKCLKKFFSRKSLRHHIKSHNNRVLHCSKCDRKFKTETAFASHQERHRRLQEFLFCEKCGKSFKSKDGYKYHRENKCFVNECNFCHETFTETAALKEHMKETHDVFISRTDEEKRLEAQTSMCCICGKLIKDINLERHMMIHNEDKPFICDLCGKRFKFKNAIRDHMMIKLGMKDYVCEVCGRKFVKRCYLNKHVKFHFANTEEGIHCCGICNKQFFDKNSMAAHKCVDNPKPLICDLCSKSFTSKSYLRQHLLGEVICLLCDEIFASNDLLKQHVISSHPLEKYRQAALRKSTRSSFVYPCEICGRRFTSEERYQQHQASELLCDLCDAKFTKNEELKLHIESEHDLQEYRKTMTLRWKKKIKLGDVNSTEYTCNLCGKKLFYKRTLLLHMRMHTGLKPYKCEYCQKAYTSKHSLNAHLISEMNLRKFVCSYCGKRYNFNSDLIVHVKQRHESRQFSCHVCGKEFGLLKYLKDHSTIHSQNKPFNCDKCKMGFRLRKFLLRHNKKYHTEEEQQIFDIEVVTDQ